MYYRIRYQNNKKEFVIYGKNALYNAGYTIEQVSSQTRHSNINTTQQYLKTEKEDMMSLANKL